jgi:hypothetical protein
MNTLLSPAKTLLMFGFTLHFTGNAWYRSDPPRQFSNIYVDDEKYMRGIEA